MGLVISLLGATYFALSKYGGKCTFYVEHTRKEKVSIDQMATENLHLLPEVILRGMPESYSSMGVVDLRTNGLQLALHIEQAPKRSENEQMARLLQVAG